MGKPNITPEKRKAMPPRGRGKKSMIIEALKQKGKTPEQFWALVVDKALYGEGNPQLIQLLGQRLEAPFKPTMPPVDIGITARDSLDTMANKVMAAGLPPDVAEKMLSAIKMRHEISEKGELQKRLERIEEMLKNGGTAKAD